MIQYLTNAKGRTTAVQIPIKEWEAIQAQLKKPSVLDDLRQAWQEMKEMEAKGVKGMTKEELMQDLFADGKD